MKSITMDEVKSRLPNIKIIDIRDNYQFNLGSIPTAINIPMKFLLKNPENYFNKNEEYYLLCQFGLKSKKVARELNELGYNTYNIVGGYSDYK